MWALEEDMSNKNTIGRPTKTSSSSSSSPSSSSSALPEKSMEEVWREIRPLTLLQEAHRQNQQHNPTALTLGSGQSDGRDQYCSSHEACSDGLTTNVSMFTNSCFDNYTLCASPNPSAGVSTYCAKKRALEQQLDDGFGVDHRKKRLIKNRESAARSRARKQAYTSELEQEVAHLLDENSRLKRQYEELRLSAATQAPTKRKLHRASSAPV